MVLTYTYVIIFDCHKRLKFEQEVVEKYPLFVLEYLIISKSMFLCQNNTQDALYTTYLLDRTTE